MQQGNENITLNVAINGVSYTLYVDQKEELILKEVAKGYDKFLQRMKLDFPGEDIQKQMAKAVLAYGLNVHLSESENKAVSGVEAKLEDLENLIDQVISGTKA
jgi:cell division protein ZapA (FtsZ GTPase activity inhibitor)